MLERLIRGDPRRRTRLHDFEGNRLEWPGLRDLPASVCTALLRKAGIEAQSPWWPYPAIRRLESLLDAAWRVLEFGAGASTAWLAHRVRHVLSLESSGDWHARVRARLRALGCTHVELLLCEDRADYVSADHCDGPAFDFAVVDGAWRDLCARTAVRVVRPGGYVYLDNSDVLDADHRGAVATLLDAAAGVERFVGLCPGTVAVNQGLLIRLRAG